MWVGIIALADVDAEIGLVMLLSLDAAHECQKAEGRMNTLADLQEGSSKAPSGFTGRTR